MTWTARQSLAAGAATVTVAITGGAFWLSYEHLHDVAAANGLPGVRAWAWPGVIDSFIIAGEILMLRASLRRGRFDWFACLLASVGSVGSIALNVAGVGPAAAPMQYVVAAVPPSAALLAFAAVMRQLHGALAKEPAPQRAAAEPAPSPAIPRPELVPAGVRLLPLVGPGAAAREPGTVAHPEVVPAGARLLPLVAAEMTTEVTLERIEPEPEQAVIRPAVQTGWRALDWPPVSDRTVTALTRMMTTPTPADEARQVVTVPVTITPAELRKRARKLNREAVNDTGRPVTIATLMDELGLSRRDATALRREITDGRRS
ncbi:DUF2637 domain-containing protein [Streptomyces tremellae]|uniref:DUF2637 domain-containing protein n=1 Tax=Streptomyces tremellae TaxID=1124239 RepID=A0ABP7EY20_9ACTN